MKPEYGTLEWRRQTCSYCSKTFCTKELFMQHWKACPNRIRYGYIEDPKVNCPQPSLTQTETDNP